MSVVCEFLWKWKVPNMCEVCSTLAQGNNFGWARTYPEGTGGSYWDGEGLASHPEHVQCDVRTIHGEGQCGHCWCQHCKDAKMTSMFLCVCPCFLQYVGLPIPLKAFLKGVLSLFKAFLSFFREALIVEGFPNFFLNAFPIILLRMPF